MLPTRIVRPNVVAALAAILCGVLVAPPAGARVRATATSVVGPATLLGPVTKQIGCVSRDGLPDRGCTPGAVDPRVTQENLDETICRRGGYTGTVRPPESYTEALKRTQISAYGAYAGRSLSRYEEDHLVSLELGGSPDSPANLWPEAHSDGRYGSYVKDKLENALHAKVCSGALTLATAQHEIATDWEAAYRALVKARTAGALPAR